MTRSSGQGAPANLTQKLLRSHLVDGELVPGQDIRVDVDQILVEDATGTMAGMQFELLGVDEATVPLAVLYVDHNVLQIDDKNMQDHHYLRSFSERYGLWFSPPGHGISHYIHIERFARPGQLLVGADSHTTTSGGAGHVRHRRRRAGGRGRDGRLRLRAALPAGRRGRAHRPAAGGGGGQ